MADFGVAVTGLTRRNNECILCQSLVHEECVYEFTIKRRVANSTKSFWKCSGCHSLKCLDKNAGGTVPVIAVEDGRLMTDPDNTKNPHFCTPKAAVSVVAKQLGREVVNEVKTSGKRPHEAFNEAAAYAVQAYSDNPQLREEVQDEMPKFKNLRSALYRSWNEKYPVIRQINNIPEGLKRTLVGASAKDAQDPHFEEGYFILEQHDPPFIVIGSRLDLNVLHVSSHWVADGTFKYCPREFGFHQLYVVIGFINGEAIRAVHALMPNRRQETYQTLFSTIRNALVQNFGTVGEVKFGHFDFEMGAMGGFRASFPGVAVKGCAFHFGQAINKRLGELGLKPIYDRSEARGYNAPQYAVVRTWVRRIVALCLLRVDYVRRYWDRSLKNPPQVGIGAIDEGLQELANYIEGQWLRTPEQIELFNHHDHDGPRTNNNAEGYNSSLRAKYRQPHPQLSHFLVQFQQLHHEEQMRAKRLFDGQRPEAKKQVYVDNDQAITDAKRAFHQILAALPRGPGAQERVDREITRYLDEIEQYLGKILN